LRIEDYGFVGDAPTGALVGRDGAVDWLCLPRFDSTSCLAALVGDERHGSWRLAPAGALSASSRRYGAGQLLACSFWLVHALALNGRVDVARALFERLLGLANDLGPLAEEYDVERRRQVGNFPQAFSHLTLIGAAYAIAAAESDAKRSNGGRVAPQMEVTR
jgi:GH15 family glucan-1,4-alpha-glucosidase